MLKILDNFSMSPKINSLKTFKSAEILLETVRLMVLALKYGTTAA